MSRDDMDSRLNEEVRFHIEMATRRNLRAGMAPDEARRQARLQFGASEDWKEEARTAWRGRRFADLRKDVLHATRVLRRHRGFTATAVVTLALGIGASTAIFSVVNAVLLRPLPYADAGRLVLIWGDMRARGVTDFPFSPGNFRDLRHGTTVFEDLAALATGNQGFTVPGETPEEVSVTGVTPNLLPLLGARVVFGRQFTDDDALAPPAAAPGAQAAAQAPPLPAMVILNHGFWQRRFGGDAGVVGKTVDLSGNPGRIVGVLAPGFDILWPPNTNIPANPDVFVAMRIDYETAPRINVFMRVVGRLRPGASLQAARFEAERVAADTREKVPVFGAADLHYRVEPMHDDLVRDVRPALLALMGAVAFVLLIACANVANLLLVRGAARERELAIRTALGSSPWRIVRQLLAENLVLASGGALLGLGVAWWGTRLLVGLSPANVPRLEGIGIDPVVLAFTTLAALAAAAIFGVLPAVRASRPDPANVLRTTGRAAGLGRGQRLRNGVVIAEVALAFVLLIGGGLMVRSFVALSRVDPGFDAAGLTTFTVGFRIGLSEDQRAAFVREMRERLRAIPGALSVSAVNPLPLDGQLSNCRWGKEEAATDPARFQQANQHIVLPGYFETMGTRLVEGRVYTDADSRPDFTGIVIDDLLARKAFPGEPATGKRLLVRTFRSQEPEWLDVIGVVQHQRHESLVSEGREAIFFTDGFFHHGTVGTWVVRLSCDDGACDQAGVMRSARAVVSEVDPSRAVARLQPMGALVARAMTPTRFALVLIGVFAAVAAVLAAVGLYGVLATAVRQRTAEIGVRMAFGASGQSIVRMVVRDGLKLSLVGLALGLASAVILTRAMTSMLVGVQATDVPTYVAIITVFIGIAVAACLIAAVRAASLDPVTALRTE